MQQQKQYIHHNIIIYFAYLTAQWLVFKKPRSKAQEQDQERGIPGYPCTVTVYQWEVCSLATSVAQKTGLCGQGAFAAYPRQAKRCLSAVFHDHLTAPVLLRHFYRQRKPSSHWYTMPPQERGFVALHSGVVAASRQFKSL